MSFFPAATPLSLALRLRLRLPPPLVRAAPDRARRLATAAAAAASTVPPPPPPPPRDTAHVVDALLHALWAGARRAHSLAEPLLQFEQLTAALAGAPPPLSAWNALLLAATRAPAGARAAEVLAARIAASGLGWGDATTVHLRLMVLLAPPPAADAAGASDSSSSGGDGGGGGGWRAGAALLAAAAAGGVAVAPGSYAALVAATAASGVLGEAVALARLLPDAAARRHPGVHQALMLAFARARQPDAALRTWREFLAQRQPAGGGGAALPPPVPTREMCNLAIEACAQLAEASEAAAGLDAGRDAARAGGPAATAALADEAAHILERMPGWGLSANEVTFGFYGALLLASGREAEALGVPALMAELGVPPTHGIYTKLAAAFVARGDYGAAVRVFRAMLAGGLAPTVVTYTVLLTACADSGRMGQAAKLLRAMAAGDGGGVAPTAHTANTLLHGLLRRGRPDLAAALLAALPRGGVAPDEVSVRTLALDAALVRGELHEAVACVELGLRLFESPNGLRGGLSPLFALAVRAQGAAAWRPPQAQPPPPPPPPSPLVAALHAALEAPPAEAPEAVAAGVGAWAELLAACGDGPVVAGAASLGTDGGAADGGELPPALARASPQHIKACFVRLCALELATGMRRQPLPPYEQARLRESLDDATLAAAQQARVRWGLFVKTSAAPDAAPSPSPRRSRAARGE